MIQKLCALLCLATLFYIPSLFSTSSEQNATLNWQTDYEAASNNSADGAKPIVLFFTGSDWCNPCHQFEDNVFNSERFIDAAADKFVFIKVDMPRYKPQDPQQKKQNTALLDKYDVDGFPTVVVVDRKHNQITRLVGYQSGEANTYVDQIVRMASE